MAGIKDSFTQTVYRITPTGGSGYWWVAKDSLDEVIGLSYSTGITLKTVGLWKGDDFMEVMTAIVDNNINIKNVEINIDVEKASDKHGLVSQFQSPALTSSDLTYLASNFNVPELCKKFGVYQLVRRFYKHGDINLANLQDILIYLGINKNLKREKIWDDILGLLYDDDITEAQFDAFWANWSSQVEGQ